MKCGACGYQRVVKKEYVDVAVGYKSGPRKGEYKTTENRCVELEIGHEEFKTLDVKTGDCEYKTLFVCPECGTVRVDASWDF